MTENDAIHIFQDTGALWTGHFVGSSGRHMDQYIDKWSLFRNTKETSRLCKSLAEAMGEERIATIVGPETGGIVVSQWVAHHLTSMKWHRVFALRALESDNDTFSIREDDKIYIWSRRVAVVDDIANKGGSLEKTIASVRAAGGTVVSAAVLWNRGGITANDLGIPRLHAVVNRQLRSYKEGPLTCPMCADDLKRGSSSISTEYGHGARYLARK